MSDSKAVREARADAERSRQQLMNTARELQVRLAPRTIARDAWEGAKDKSAGLASQAADVVKERPVAAGAAATGVLLLIVGRPLFGLAGRWLGRNNRTNGEQDGTATEWI